MIPILAINQKTIAPIKQAGGEKKKPPMKHESLFKTEYPNVALLAPKRSGKSTTIAYVLDEALDPPGESPSDSEPLTQIYAFVSTLHADDVWKHLAKKWGDQFHGYQSIKEGKINHLEPIIKQYLQPAQSEAPPQPVLEKGLGGRGIRFTPLVDPLVDKAILKGADEKKPKYRVPRVVFIFDDQGSSLRDKSVGDLVRRNRHAKSLVLISSQFIHDFTPDLYKNLDYLLAFRKQSEDKLMIIHEKMGLILPFATMMKLYTDATSADFSFLYISRDDEYRKNFDKQYDVSKYI